MHSQPPTRLIPSQSAKGNQVPSHLIGTKRVPGNRDVDCAVPQLCSQRALLSAILARHIKGSPEEGTKGILCINCYPKEPTEVRV